MPSRPYINCQYEALKKIFDDNFNNLAVLQELEKELRVREVYKSIELHEMVKDRIAQLSHGKSKKNVLEKENRNKCPECGGELKKKTARRGKYSGNEFLGCSNYPQCKYIKNIDNGDNGDDEYESEPNLPKREVTPRNAPKTAVLRAREVKAGYRVDFVQSTAVHATLVDFIATNDIDLSSFNQWRLDYPEKTNKLSEVERDVLSVLEKIILRGRVTILTSDLEDTLLESFEPKDAWEFLGNIPNNLSKSPYRNYWFDGEEERVFYSEILPQILGDDYLGYVIPQVQINSLLDIERNDFKSQRVDFLISFPDSALKLVVEIDGAQHSKEIVSDASRDSALTSDGFTVVRIPTYEIHDGKGEKLSYLTKIIKAEKKSFNCDKRQLRLLNAFKCSHQIQFALLRALRNGQISMFKEQKIGTDLNELDVFDEESAEIVFKNTVIDFYNTLQHLLNLLKYEKKVRIPELQLDIEEENIDMLISFNNNEKACPTYLIQNIFFPKCLSFPEYQTNPLASNYSFPQKEDLEYFIKYIFRKDEFREGQFRALVKILNGEDCLILLPTGAGKSIVYQLASFLMPGITLVVDPIIALMNDQVQNLLHIGIDRCKAISSEMESQIEKENALLLLARGDYLFTFISPERFLNEEFRKSISALAARMPIPLVVVDEAHCVSEWGHDFRPAYLSLADSARRYCARKDLTPILVGLTGTASISVLNDVKRELKIDLTITPESFDRKELEFSYINVHSDGKSAQLERILTVDIPKFFNTRGLPTEDSGLVFCPHVDTKFGVVKVKAEIDNWVGEENTRFYCGKPPRNWNESDFNEYKRTTAREFKNNEFPLLICTKSFGMGIDKANIHYTIHYNLPPSIEAFYQEAGRAGRDRKRSLCYILFSFENHSENNRLLNPTTPIESIHSFIENQKGKEKDDISRMLYFHCTGFMGVKQELKIVIEVVRNIGNLSRKGKYSIYLTKLSNDFGNSIDARKNNIEKAIIRLVRIGVISDYTYDYSKKHFSVSVTGIPKETIINVFEQYISTYLVSRGKIEADKLRGYRHLDYDDFTIKASELLLTFIYEVVEKSRRAALSEMLRAVIDSRNTAQFRERILNYLQPTPYTRDIEDIIFAENLDLALSFLDRVFDTVLSRVNAKELRGQIERYLESYPDHPLLRILHSLIESVVEDPNELLIIEEFMAGIQFGHKKYGYSEEELTSISTNFLARIATPRPDTAEKIINQLLIYWKDEGLELRELVDELIDKLPIEVTGIPAWVIVDQLNKKANRIIELLV